MTRISGEIQRVCLVDFDVLEVFGCKERVDEVLGSCVVLLTRLLAFATSLGSGSFAFRSGRVWHGYTKEKLEDVNALKHPAEFQFSYFTRVVNL